MVARESFALEGLYIVEEHELPEYETTHGPEHYQPQVSLQLNDVVGPHHLDSYNFDDCYSDDSSKREDDEVEFSTEFENTISHSLSLQELFNEISQISENDGQDDDSIFTFNSFRNASRRGVRKTNYWCTGSGGDLLQASLHSTSLSIDPSINELRLTGDEEESSEI